MRALWQRIPEALRRRPFGIYTSLLVFSIGVYGFFTDADTNLYDGNLPHLFIKLISIYLIAAGVVVLSASFADRRKHAAFSIFGEMYGWLFIAAAALATSFTYIGSYVYIDNPEQLATVALWLVVWGFLFLCSGVRAVDILVTHKESTE